MRASTASALPTASIGPRLAASGQNHGLEGAVKHELNLDVVRTIRKIGPFWLPSSIGRRWQEKKS